MTKIKRWERQSDEGGGAFQAFILYRDGLQKRSLNQVSQSTGKVMSQIRDWSVKHDWVARAAAWDSHVDKQTQVTVIGAIQNMKEEQIELALRLRSIADSSLQKLQSKLDDLENNPRAALTPDQIVKFAEAGAKLERLNRDEPDSIQKVQTYDYSKLSGDELLQLKELMLKAGDSIG